MAYETQKKFEIYEISSMRNVVNTLMVTLVEVHSMRHLWAPYVEYIAVSDVFQNIDPPPPSPTSEGVLPPHQRRGVHTVRGWGSIVWKTPDIRLASYSIISLRIYGTSL